MHLIIDNGNSRCKTAFFDKEHISSVQTNKELSIELLNTLLNEQPTIEKGILSSVKSIEKKTLQFFKKKFNGIILNSDTPLPIKTEYQNTETLGSDRIANVCAAEFLFPMQNSLVIDIGTCITYDLLLNGIHKGGYITPGLNMKAKAMNNFSDKLPLVSPYKEYSTPGKTTKTSMIGGIVEGTFNEIERFIKNYENEFNDLNILITGGDMKLFEIHLKNSIFADSNLTLKGLYNILKFNENQ
ncbi:MAG: type III pantothenate kinase [Flavobacteriales bacterium]